MTFKEFLETRPEDVEKAKACKTIDEFKKLVDSVGISYKDNSELQQAFDFIKNGQKQLSENDLDDVAGGGNYRRHKATDTFISGDRSTILTDGTGKKV